MSGLARRTRRMKLKQERLDMLKRSRDENHKRRRNGEGPVSLRLSSLWRMRADLTDRRDSSGSLARGHTEHWRGRTDRWRNKVG